MPHRSFLLALSLLTACAGSAASGPRASRAAESEDGPSPRAVRGEACVANYRADLDLTAVAVDIGSVGIVGAVVPGDGWEIDCRPDGDRFVAGESRATHRLVTITVDRSATGAIDLEAYARAQLERALERMWSSGMTGVRASEPQIVAEGAYVVAMEGEAEGQHFAQLNVHRVFESPIGLVRFHLSEIAPDGRVLNEHGPTLLRAASAFGQVPEEALAESSSASPR